VDNRFSTKTCLKPCLIMKELIPDVFIFLLNPRVSESYAHYGLGMNNCACMENSLHVIT